MKLRKGILKSIALMSIGVITAVSLAACGASNKEKSGDSSKKVKLAYVNWAEGVAMTNLAKVVLEEKMGYTVEMTEADPGVIFTSLAEGDTDAFLDGWLPVTHKNYMDKYKDKLLDLGTSFKGAKIGLVVPKYVDVNSVEELKANKDKFNGKIIGIDAGAGIMETTKKAVSEYGLDMELMEGSEPAMLTMLKDAIDKKKPIVITGWAPHWKFSKWDLKFLEDSKKVYGEAEDIHKLARLEFDKDMPEAAEFLKNFTMDEKQLGDLMAAIADGQKPLEAAKEWMNKNEDIVNSWVPKK
ncbi:glycine betaine/proline transport system substrate-binding protein [Clostridium pascui]|uniref:glycine betaine ABC transporter substrate-binding protein n=1 Tax=Clostridium pascui TaxID=46609 RepID=UPI00195E8F5B|nr:glycine betaine ABC transporter substrate-binding protein [Clostridium pascui]MBM7870346.1 glycine betaine/proline transport system substrate-binding protein [Clostridium pascui]